MDFKLSKEQRDIMYAAREFASKEFAAVAYELDCDETFDVNLWKRACELGFVGVFIDEKYGGANYGYLEHCLIVEEFLAVDAGIGAAILSTTFGAELLNLFGSEEQKKLVLPQLISGEAILATAITEPDAGSDVTETSTVAIQDGDHWVINGTKLFITGGDIAKYVNVFAVTNPEDSSCRQHYSFILVPTDNPGFAADKLRGKLGIRASNTAKLSFSEVRVPTSNLIGTEGGGFQEVAELLNRVRPMIAAMSVGVARAALEESIKYTKKRYAFGVPISSFEITKTKLAEMATMIRAARNLYYEAAWSLDNRIIDHSLLAMAKWYAGEIAVKCADEALQMHGGYGYMDEYRVQRFYRDAKTLEIWDGTKETEKLLIAAALLC